METNTAALAPSLIRILVVDRDQAANSALAGWLRCQPAFEIIGPAASVSPAAMMAQASRPHVVLLDFDRLTVPVAEAVALFKVLSPAPYVFVVAHDITATLRSRLAAAGVDAVFGKTSELEALAGRIADIQARLSDEDTMSGPALPPESVT